MELSFDTITFYPSKEGVRGLLLKYFTFTIPEENLLQIGPYQVTEGVLHIEAHEKKRARAMSVLAAALEDLTCTITRRPARYIDAMSGVPLQGALEFGIIDRGSNVIEIRPCSGCNLACTYCSVNEGPEGPKIREFLIEKQYLLQEFEKIASIKSHPMEIFIETQGEPLLYDDLPELIADLKSRGDVTQITMVTNGTFLTEQRAQELAEAGLDRINWSINSLDPEIAREIAGRPYNVEKIKEQIRTASKYLDILICPVIMKGINEHEIEDFIQFAQEIRTEEPIIGFQNFLYYKGGRNPVSEIPMDDFSKKIIDLEQKYNTRLKLGAEDFHIVEDAQREKPFKKRDIISVQRLFPGRQKNETFCKADDRIIKVIGRTPNRDKFNVQILRDKHNIFLAKAL